MRRAGYGSAYSTIAFTDTTVHKTYTESTKARDEIAAIGALETAGLPMPQVVSVGDNGYIMERMIGYTPLWMYPLTQDHVNRVMRMLQKLHRDTQQDNVCPWADIKHEAYDKVLCRYRSCAPIIEQQCHGVHTVNGARVLPFSIAVDRIMSLIRLEYDASPPHCCVMHGDCQFNNVLYHPMQNKLVFIDPRGRFGGNSSTTGIAEYDIAKLLFALSGYDAFDSQDRGPFATIADGKAIIPMKRVGCTVPSNRLARLLSATIWLGNAHSFARSNPDKAVASHLYALHYATTILEEHNVERTDAKHVEVVRQRGSRHNVHGPGDV